MSAKPSMSASTESAARANHPLRPISFGTPAVHVERRDDGTIYLRPKAQLRDYPVRITDRLHHWAAAAPDRVFMAERNAARGWRQITYAELLTSSRHIASALLARGLSAEKPVVILSGNSVDHALIAFGALYAGIPFCPVSPAYSLVSRDYGKLGYLMKLLPPGLVFADNATKFADALAANVSFGTEIAASRGAVPGRDVTTLADLMATPQHPRLDAVHEAIGPDTIAKFLLTSGSTGNPKAVINTQRMICANQVMLRETLAFLKDEPPVIVDWLPWNHTFGGNHNIGLPVLGNDAKLVPNNGKLEVRAKGPNVMPGYWRQPDMTAKAFDEEGFYKMGDALKPVDPDNFDAGFDFDGRTGEDFKLASGTWVSVGPLRARFVAACAPLVRDVVIAGINRDEISALVVLDLDGSRLINPTLPSDDLATAASDPLIVAAFRERFQALVAGATGSSTRIVRAVLLDTPLSIDRGEVTDKGSINQRAVLENRNALIEEIYSPAPPAQVITL